MTKLTKGSAYARALSREVGYGCAELSQIANKLNLQILEVDAHSFDGALIRAREVPFGQIVIRKSIRELGRKYFTVAHEIGHFLLQHDATNLVCTQSDIATWVNGPRQAEREANDFAAEILMPVSAVEPIIRDAAPSIQLIERIARIFHTSLSAAAWRYCDLTQEVCAVVWSTDRRIEWAKRSEAFRYPLLHRAPIQPNTFASQCFSGSPGPIQPLPISANLWISTKHPISALQILEQSKALPSYQSVISLLCVKK